MKLLVACESSGVIRRAFASRGHDAWSCDLLLSEDSSDKHIVGDALPVIRKGGWDLIISHPPCTDLASSGARWFAEKRADGRQQRSIALFMDFVDACGGAPFAIENPIGIMSTHYRKPDQIIQPWMFGHGETKATCLWLSKLPNLQATNIVDGREPRVWKMPPSPDRWRERSRTYEGIAQAMATQWGY